MLIRKLILSFSVLVFSLTLFSCASVPTSLNLKPREPDLVSKTITNDSKVAYIFIDKDFDRWLPNGADQRPSLQIDQEAFSFVDDSHYNSLFETGRVYAWKRNQYAIVSAEAKQHHITFEFGVFTFFNSMDKLLGRRHTEFDLTLEEGKSYYFISLEGDKPGWLDTGAIVKNYPLEFYKFAKMSQKTRTEPGLYVVVFDQNKNPESYKLLSKYEPVELDAILKSMNH